MSTPELYKLAEGLFYGRVYWVAGTLSQSAQVRYSSEVRDPPSSGWSHCFVVDRGAKFVTLFCPFMLESFQVSRQAEEFLRMSRDLEYGLDPKQTSPQFPRYVPVGFKEWTPERQARLTALVLKTWANSERMGLAGKDFDTAALILNMLGGSVPMRVVEEGAEAKQTGGKGADVLGLLKPVKRNGRRGQVLRFFMEGPRPIREAMAEFGVTRSNILSQLYIIQKDHGIGYVLANEAASVQMPPGCDDPFEPEGDKKP